MPRTRWRAIAVAAIASVLTLPAAAATHTVTIQGMQFEPQSLTAQRGDTIVWINRDLVPHSVTAAPAFDSGAIAPNQKWSYVAKDGGRYDYGCSFHPTMKGHLLVE